MTYRALKEMVTWLLAYDEALKKWEKEEGEEESQRRSEGKEARKTKTRRLTPESNLESRSDP